jgi:hypothetical protein
LVGTIEREHRVELNARRDMTLDSLLVERGFDSITQLLNAYQGRARSFARRRRLFLRFDADDKAQLSAFRLMAQNPNVEIDFYETSLKVPINSEDGTYLRQALRQKIGQASVLVCLIGNATASSEWAEWEIHAAKELGKGLCGVRLKGSHGRNSASPEGCGYSSREMGHGTNPCCHRVCCCKAQLVTYHRFPHHRARSSAWRERSRQSRCRSL